MDLWSKLTQSFYLGRKSFFEKLLDVLSFFYVRIYLMVYLMLNLALWLIVYSIFAESKENLIALHYNVDFGVNLIGSVNKVFILPTVGLLIILVNFSIVISAYRMKSAKFLIHILLFTPVLVHLFLLTAAVSIYLINFY